MIELRFSVCLLIACLSGGSWTASVVLVVYDLAEPGPPAGAAVAGLLCGCLAAALTMVAVMRSGQRRMEDLHAALVETLVRDVYRRGYEEGARDAEADVVTLPPPSSPTVRNGHSRPPVLT